MFGSSSTTDLSNLLSPDAFVALDAYSRSFKIRQVWLTPPPARPPLLAELGTREAAGPVRAQVTDRGSRVFSSLNPDVPLLIEDMRVHQVDASPDWTPLLVDDNGYWLALSREDDGLEQMLVTVDQDSEAIPSQALLGDICAWAGRGVFVGQRRVTLAVHVDDVFISSSQFSVELNRHDPRHAFRMSAEDLAALAAWQRDIRSRYPQLRDFRLDLVFNGIGPLKHGPDDALTETAKVVKGDFRWVSHTYSHVQMDNASEEEAYEEIVRNHEVARRLGLPTYQSSTLVTGEMSGLYNPNFLRAARRAGVQFVASDSSFEDQQSPRPNRGIRSWYDPELTLVPRVPLEIYYDVTTPEELVARYNQRHPSEQLLTYDEIVYLESDRILSQMLRSLKYPFMFHQANLKHFDEQGERCLLTDVLTAALEKYVRVCSLPVGNPSFLEIGSALKYRLELDEVTVEALIDDWQQIALLSNRDVLVRITGVEAGSRTYYAGEPTSLVNLEAERWQVIPLRTHD